MYIYIYIHIYIYIERERERDWTFASSPKSYIATAHVYHRSLSSYSQIESTCQKENGVMKNRKCKTMIEASRKRSPHCMGVIFRRKTTGHSNMSRRNRYKTRGRKNENEQDHCHSTIPIYSIENRYKISSKKRSPWSMGVKIDEKPISHSNVSEKASTEWRFQTLFLFFDRSGIE